MPWKMWSFTCWLAWGCPSLWFLFYFGSWNRVNIDTSLTYRIPQKMWTFIILVAFLLQTFSDFVPVSVTICRIHLCYCFCVFSWWKDHKGQAGWGWGQPGIGEDVPAHGTPWNEMDPNHCRIPNRAPLCTDSRAAWPCQMPFWESQEIQGLWIFAWNTATPRCPRQSRQITAQCLLLAGRATLGSSRLPLSQCPALAGRHHDNCKDVFSCRTIVQSRGIFALLPAEVPDLLGYFFPETVFNLILLCILVFPSGRGAGRHSRKAPCRVTRDFSLQSALLSTCALPFCHLILFGPDPWVQGWQSCCCMCQCTHRSSYSLTAKIGASCKCLYGKTLKMFFFFQKIGGFFPD